jgi:hypothetical protein
LSGGSVHLWYGDGQGSFVFGESVTVASAPDALFVGDLNDDDRPDVAMSSSAADTVSVVLNGADVPPTETPTPSITPTRTRTPTRNTATPTITGTRPPTLTPTPSRTPTITPTPAGPGDANCDGFIDRRDIEGMIAQIFFHTCSAADIDGDRRVTTADLLQVIMLTAGN